MKVYFDNAATTPLRQEVIEAMLPIMQKVYGNPSSIHSFGREMRSAIEKARKTVASLLKVAPSEIFLHQVEQRLTIWLYVVPYTIIKLHMPFHRP